MVDLTWAVQEALDGGERAAAVAPVTSVPNAAALLWRASSSRGDGLRNPQLRLVLFQQRVPVVVELMLCPRVTPKMRPRKRLCLHRGYRWPWPNSSKPTKKRCGLN
jgi:hypothetical protein